MQREGLVMENMDALEMVTSLTRPVMVKWMAFTATMSTITNHQSAVREATETIMTTICVIMEACSSRLCKAASIVSNEAKVSLLSTLKSELSLSRNQDFLVSSA